MTIRLNWRREAWQCVPCGITHFDPWTTCDRCQPGPRAIEEDKFRDAAADAGVALFTDRYSADLFVWLPETNDIVQVIDPYPAMRSLAARSREDIVTAATRLRDENRELLAENARLRRALDKSDRRGR